MTATRDLTPFFAPRSVAVIGAGERPTSSGGAVMQMMRRAGYRGRAHPVNPKGGEIFGWPAATSIGAIGEPVDLAVIVIRPDAILDAVREAADAGCRNLLILPGGFAEAGPTGAARNAELQALAERRGLTIAGPNCAGIVHMDPQHPFAATFLRDVVPGVAVAHPKSGPACGVAAISQSGALIEELIDKANRRALPMVSAVSVGNGLHLGVEDHVAYLGGLPFVGSLILYIESIEDPQRFRALVEPVARIKPVIALLGGRTAVGAAAAAAHTGAVANDDEAAAAFCRACGMIRVTSLRRLLIAAKAFGRFPQGIAGRALVLSNSGGPGVLAADRASLEGLDVAPLPTRLADVLRQQLPPEASVANPLDLLADAREDRFGATLEAALAHAGDAYDSVLGIHVVPFMVDAGPVVDRLAAIAATSGLPMMHAMMGTLPGESEWFARLEAAGVPTFNDVEEMAEAAGLLSQFVAIRSGRVGASATALADRFRGRRR